MGIARGRLQEERKSWRKARSAWPACCWSHPSSHLLRALRLAGPPARLRRQAAAAAGWPGRLVKSARLPMPQGRRLCLTVRMAARAASARPRGEDGP